MKRARCEKLVVDLLLVTRLRAGMDKDISDLIVQLCTRVGIAMEDASVVALTVMGMEREERLAALIELDAAAERITVLVQAARVLMA